MNYAIIFAGGSGTRMKGVYGGVPKQFIKIKNKPILVYTLEHFQKNKNIDGIILVSREDWIKKCNKYKVNFNLTKILDIISGGRTGTESIFNGLKKLSQIARNDDIVLIHDGVRPIIDQKLINENIDVAKKYGNSISIIPAIETVLFKQPEKDLATIDRSLIYYARAPQSFKFKVIYDLYKKNIEQGKTFIDSCSLLMQENYKIHTVYTSQSNIKITNPEDIVIAKALIVDKIKKEKNIE